MIIHCISLPPCRRRSRNHASRLLLRCPSSVCCVLIDIRQALVRPRHTRRQICVRHVVPRRRPTSSSTTTPTPTTTTAERRQGPARSKQPRAPPAGADEEDDNCRRGGTTTAHVAHMAPHHRPCALASCLQTLPPLPAARRTPPPRRAAYSTQQTLERCIHVTAQPGFKPQVR